MPVAVVCECGNDYELRDEFRGRRVRCPKCGVISTAGASQGEVDPIFGRDVFLLRQKALSINEKYFVSDEHAQPLMFVVRPTHLLRNIAAVLAGVACATAVIVVFALTAAALGDGALGALVSLLGVVAYLFTLVLVSAKLSKKHVTFHAGTSAAGQKVLEILQDQKIRFPAVTFTVRDETGKRLGVLRKNYLYNFFRKRWEILGATGRPLSIVQEDSIILSLLRRVLGPLFGLLRTNFVFKQPGGDRELGEFKRKFTILDRYVLDMQADRLRMLDRKLAVAAAVMLDTGERR
jgi:hypothetical protein